MTYETILVAPINMKKRVLALIARETAIADAFRKGESPVGGRIVEAFSLDAQARYPRCSAAASSGSVAIVSTSSMKGRSDRRASEA